MTIEGFIMTLFIFAILTMSELGPEPIINHEMPTRAAGIAVVNYWKKVVEIRSDELRKFKLDAMTIEKDVRHIHATISDWGNRYDLRQTKSLYKSRMLLGTIHWGLLEEEEKNKWFQFYVLIGVLDAKIPLP